MRLSDVLRNLLGMLCADVCRLVLYYCDRQILIAARLVDRQWTSLANDALFSSFRFSTAAALHLPAYYTQIRHLCLGESIGGRPGAHPFPNLRTVTFAENSEDCLLRWAQMVPVVETSAIRLLTPVGLSYLHSAETVFIDGCVKMRAEDLEYLCNVRCLCLSAREHHLLNGLVYMQNLDKVALVGTMIVDDNLQYVGQVSELNLSYCSEITDLGMQYLGRVRVLNLSYTNVSNSGLSHLLSIEAIDLSGCRDVTGDGLQYLSGAHTVYLAYCEQITERGLAYLCNALCVDIAACPKIGETGLLYLKRPQCINLARRTVSAHGLAWTKPAHTLDLQHCTSETRKSIVSSLTHAYKIYIYGSWLEREPYLEQLLPHTVICRQKTPSHANRWQEKQGFFDWQQDGPDGRVYEQTV